MRTTVGRILVNRALPARYRDPGLVMNSDRMDEILKDIADKHPEEYSGTLRDLHEAADLLVRQPRASLTMEDLRTPKATRQVLQRLRQRIESISQMDLPPDQKSEMVQDTVEQYRDQVMDTLMDEALQNDNTFALQVLSKARGKKSDLNNMLGASMTVLDQNDRPVPIPVLHGYAEGLSPAEAWATSYGVRKGEADVKMATGKAGFLGKLLKQGSHKVTVVENDCGDRMGTTVEGGDPENVGMMLAQNVGPYKRGMIISPKMLHYLDGKQVAIRSPLTCQTNLGICQRCAGVREKNRLPDIGDRVGLTSADTISERLNQGALGSKHSAGVKEQGAEKAIPLAPLKAAKNLVEVPKQFQFAATLAQKDGRVEAIRPAPQGGSIVTVAGEDHFVSPELDVRAKVGEAIERGEELSSGIVNPAEVVRLRGIGEARKSFVESMNRVLRENNIKVSRRNLETIARGIVNEVRVLDDSVPDALPGDIVEYNSLIRNWKPRKGYAMLSPTSAVGSYLEQPVSHYTIGTPITPKIAQRLKSMGVKSVAAHKQAPPFEPEMNRVMTRLTRSKDWMERLGGSYLSKGLLEATHRGLTSSLDSPSYIPSLAFGKDFGSSLGGIKGASTERS